MVLGVLRRAWKQALRSPGCRAQSDMHPVSPQSLDELVKLDLLRREPAENVLRIWHKHHEREESDQEARNFSLDMTGEQYDKVQETSEESPVFVLPMEKPGGFVTMLVNIQPPRLLATPLEVYRQQGSEADPHVIATHYEELKSSHGVVLVRGDVRTRGLDAKEAETLVTRAHRFFADPRLAEYVKLVYRDPRKFDFDAVLQELGFDPSDYSSHPS